MSTFTTIPPQAQFEDEFELNYPGDCRDIEGQVVGPNWLGEFFVIRETEIGSQSIEDAQGRLVNAHVTSTTALCAILTKERREFLTTDARREFVARQMSQDAGEKARGFRKLEDRKEIKAAEDLMQRPGLWFMGPIIDSKKGPVTPTVAPGVKPSKRGNTHGYVVKK